MEEQELAVDHRPERNAQKRLDMIHMLERGAMFELAIQQAWVSEPWMQKWISPFIKVATDAITNRPDPGSSRSGDTMPPRSNSLRQWTTQANQLNQTETKLCGWLRARMGLDPSSMTVTKVIRDYVCCQK